MPDDLEDLQRRIDQAKPHPDGEKQDTPGAMAQAMQTGTEFVAGAAIVGTGGYFLDRWLGTSPLFFIAGFMIGFAAGVYNLMRGVSKKKNDIL